MTQLPTENSNPYQPPKLNAPSHPGRLGQSTSMPGLRYISWLLAFAVNLVVPILFALDLCCQSALVGMAVGILTLACLGCGICWKFPRFSKSFITATALVAVTQLFPMLQIIAGIIAVLATESIGLRLHGESTTSLEWEALPFLAGVLVTLLTGLIVASAGLVLSFALWPLFRRTTMTTR